ncbi:MAG: formylglycine-generating enzyme family protein, partial [Polyangiaceae bacterium]
MKAIKIGGALVALVVGAWFAVGCSAADPDELGSLEEAACLANGQANTCGPSCPCESGWGDCDSDAECIAPLVCVDDRGRSFGMHQTFDICLPAHCRNGTLDSGETSVDCGGECGVCDHCFDGVQNSGETGLDCGGSDCAACCPANGQGNTCSPTCRCSAKWGDCDSDGECKAGLKCVSGVAQYFGLNAGYDVCLAAHCTNGTQDAGELEIDCGGSDCAPCSHCSNGIQDSDEAGVDCGGTSCAACCPANGTGNTCSPTCKCPAGWGDCDGNNECNTGLICSSGIAPQFGLNGGYQVCAAPHCTNGVLDGGETGIDCGGPDCGSCVHCLNKRQDADETGVDCGGTECPSCCPANNMANTCSPTCKCPAKWGDCDGNNECQTGLVCAIGVGAQYGLGPSFDVCVAPHCANGIQDGDEQGLDCGGVDCGTCGFGPPATSCTGTPINVCGASGTENCCASASVPAATFKRAYDGVLLTDNTHNATISSYYLDKFEVNVARFRAFLADFDTWRSGGHPTTGEGAHPLVSGSGWDGTWTLAADAATLQSGLACDATATWTASAGSNEARPINCVNWYEAFAFCLWDGGRLATDTEWNAAGSGGNQQRVYPWSSPANSTTIDDTRAAYGCRADGDSGA